jgi:hypothetical protein
MPAIYETTLTVVCDNPDCPGNALDPSAVDGWTFAAVDVRGDPTLPAERVFCSQGCVAAFASLVDDGVASWAAV